LRDLGEDVHILLFLRGQVDILVAHYYNFILGYARGTQQVDEFVWKPQMDFTYEMYEEGYNPSIRSLYYHTGAFSVNLDDFKYFEMISLYRELFGDRLHVLLYEDLHMYPDRVFQVLEEILGEPIGHEVQQKAFEIKNSARLEQKSLHKHLVLNRFTAGSTNKYFNKLSEKALDLTFSAMGEGTADHNRTYVENLAKGYYRQNNRQLAEHFPDIGIQRFPNQYEL